ncbi:diiron oxygenase [Shewanella corallii]|uniref:Diiron oxygenase n=1 Tax=Shewanella corallii TaxID=560080 RepID=A0ABT0N7S6_9GAMM|nr:diiron oxygenase [Shewanella corallii]MCL2914489.1 diiron oxygenase [Shewanella corallii]
MNTLLLRADNLSKLSVKKHNVAFAHFDWPDSIPHDTWWQSPDLLTPALTDKLQNYNQQELMELSRWECINSFSLNYTGELELIQEVSRILDKVKLDEAREYLFHLIDEENQHMWYFRKFCLDYAGKVYPNKKFQLEKASLTPAQDHFLVFARILIFEEVGHYFNVQNARDDRVHPFIREINQEHYRDESRHIAYGRQVLEHLAADALAEEGSDRLLAAQLDKSIAINIGALYNPAAYRDAGLQKGMQIRDALLSDPARIDFHETKLLGNFKRLMERIGIPLS